MLKLLLADDHVLVRHAVKALLVREGMDVVAEASNGREAVELARSTRPDIAVLDMSMPEVNGLDAARQLAGLACPVPSVILSMHGEEQYVTMALRLGVRGYVLKHQHWSELVEAVRTVARGDVYLSPGVSKVVAQYYGRADQGQEVLAPRDWDILRLVGEGRTSKEIAALLGVRAKTAESYRARLMEKLGVHNAAELVRYAIRTGMLTP